MWYLRIYRPGGRLGPGPERNLGKYDENTVTAVAPDNVLIELNYTDLEKLGIDYVVAKKDLNEAYDMEFEELYAEDGLYIFKPIYK